MSKTAVKLQFYISSAATFSHEMRFECQKLKSFCEFGWSAGNAATLSHEMRFQCQKLKSFCEFGCSGGDTFARNEVRVSNTDVFFCEFGPLVN